MALGDQASPNTLERMHITSERLRMEIEDLPQAKTTADTKYYEEIIALFHAIIDQLLKKKVVDNRSIRATENSEQKDYIPAPTSPQPQGLSSVERIIVIQKLISLGFKNEQMIEKALQQFNAFTAQQRSSGKQGHADFEIQSKEGKRRIVIVWKANEKQ